MAPEVSVVMPVYNCEAYVGLAIESILSQTYKALKLIVVDDASTDNTPAILAQYESDGVRVLRHEQNLGVTRARNAGIAVAEGDYIAAMDADDISMPERIARQVEYLENHPQLLAVGCWYATVDPEGRVLGEDKRDLTPAELRQQLLERNVIAGPPMLIRTQTMRKLGGYRLWLAEDYDLWLRLTDKGPWIGIVPEVLYLLRRQHPSLCSTSSSLVDLCGWVAKNCAWERRNGRLDPLDGMTPEQTREFSLRIRRGRGHLGRKYHADQHWHSACRAHAEGKRMEHLRELSATLRWQPGYRPAWQALGNAVRRHLGLASLPSHDPARRGGAAV